MFRNRVFHGIVVASLGLPIGFAAFLFGIDRAIRHAPVAFSDPDHL